MATVGGNTRGVPQVYCHGEPPVLILGGFTANAAGDIPTANVWGKGFTVAKVAAAGAYSVTLDTKMRGYLHGDFTVANTTAAGGWAVKVNTCNLQASTSLTLMVTLNGAATNLSAGDSLSFGLWGTITDLNAGKAI